jgi:DNA-binding FadR family transcriptional regulator
VIARRLEDEVVERGWPVGEVLGSEPELLERFGVSRAVFREAVRVVEHTGAARMRRGPGGGLIVTEPNRTGVVRAMTIWFSYVGVTMDEIIEARQVVLEGACRLAAGRRDRRSRSTDLRGTLDGSDAPGEMGVAQLAAIEGRIADLAGNPALTLFVDAVADLGLSRLRSGRARFAPALTREDVEGRLKGYRLVIESVRTGEGGAAADLVRDLGLIVRLRLSDSAAAAPALSGAGIAAAFREESSQKRAEIVAELMRDHIERSGWPVGQVLGSESELIDQFGVSRAILREAIRILEHHGAVTTKRGPRGGILVSAPDSAAIVRSAELFLEYEGVTASNLSETRSVIEVAAARLAAERRTPDLVSRLLAELEREGVSGDAAMSFGTLHHTIAECTGNRLLALFVDVMGELVPPHLKPEWRTPRAQSELSTEVHKAHERLVSAIAAGDPDQAGRRMNRHMVASAKDFA